jgi:hypothetical protein
MTSHSTKNFSLNGGSRKQSSCELKLPLSTRCSVEGTHHVQLRGRPMRRDPQYRPTSPHGPKDRPSAGPLLHLFAFPAESNYSGARLDPYLATAVKDPQGIGASLIATLSSQHQAEPESLQPISAPLACSSKHLPAENAMVEHTDDCTIAESFAKMREPSGIGHCDSIGCAGVAPRLTSRWLVLVDAAKACSAKPPDLSNGDIDMMVCHLTNLRRIQESRNSTSTIVCSCASIPACATFSAWQALLRSQLSCVRQRLDWCRLRSGFMLNSSRQSGSIGAIILQNIRLPHGAWRPFGAQQHPAAAQWEALLWRRDTRCLCRRRRLLRVRTDDCTIGL